MPYMACKRSRRVSNGSPSGQVVGDAVFSTCCLTMRRLLAMVLRKVPPHERQQQPDRPAGVGIDHQPDPGHGVWLGHRWDMAQRTTAVTTGSLRLAQLQD